jgi:hypothetical protein
MKKNLFVIGIGFLFIGASILSSCEGPTGPEGAMGPAGPTGANGAIGATGPKGVDGLNGVAGVNGMNGKDGINGTDGKDANSSCLVCHTVANFDAKITEYQKSKHYLGNTSGRNGKYCARCHTHEGFQEILSYTKYVVSNDMPNATRINCKTCHAHKGFDFSGDTASQILTTTSPVSLNYNKNTATVDFGKINNLCVQCHQIRGITATVYSDTTLTPDALNKPFDQLPYFPFSATKDDNANVSYLAGRSFAVHDGNQSNLSKGINGYEYTGVTYPTTWKHADASCTDCHMNTYNAVTNVGGHTLWVNEASCSGSGAGCHNGSDKIGPTQAYIDGLRVQLGELLTARKVFKKTTSGTTVSYSALNTHDFNGKIYANDGGIYATSSSNNTVSATTGLVVYGNILKYAVDADNGKRINRQWKYGELGAAYNYAYITSELSLGAHNPPYAAKLLQASIDWLNANPAPVK